jgi:uncharacterized damage-inducible protein DinB
MRSADLLADAFGRIDDGLHRAVEGLSPTQLAARIDPGANPIGWLSWHVSRVQDEHVASVAGRTQCWTEEWAGRFGLAFDPTDIGYGHTSEQVGAVRADAGLLVAYHDAVHAVTLDFVAGCTDDDLDRVVDTRWDPPVTLAVRLVSVIQDNLEHVGQAAYARGILERR